VRRLHLSGRQRSAQPPGDLPTPLQETSLDVEVRTRDGRLPSSTSLAQLTATSASRLRSLTVLIAGVPGAQSAGQITELHRAFCDATAFSADFLLDADADACAALSRGPTSLREVLDLSRALRREGVPVRWRVAAATALVYRLEPLFSLAADEEVDIVLLPVDHQRLDDDAHRFLSDFISFRLLGEERDRSTAARAAYYQAMLAWIASRQAAGRAVQERILVVERDAGDDCRTREEFTRLSAAVLGRETRLSQPAAPKAAVSSADIVEVLSEGARAVAAWTLTAARGHAGVPVRRDPPRTLPRVLAVGAYGGDHIGDTAILAGVLLRMHRRYGTSDAIVVSQRAAHTRRLVAMLDLPVRVTVADYRQPVAASLLEQIDGVVFAGGPLMDLPKQLVKHLYTVARARRLRRPFIIEGIGAGPFIRRASFRTARLFVRMAERITVRTAEDARRPLVRGLRPETGRDPAFDYLETRRGELTRLPDGDRGWLDRLFEGTTGRPIVAINLRPLRPDYSVGATAAERLQYTRAVERRFEERLADAMKRFHQAADEPPCFLFFPMNSIQFGSSDLRSAYRLQRLTGENADLRVWQADPSIDGIIALLRRVDVAITMRFHATIYALSQGCPVIGVDYRPGKKDKVAALLEDDGQGHNCRRIDEITTDWLFDRLVQLMPPRISGSSLRQGRRHVPR
jgi:polysaccharide pyruvyl transferase WcaK-like protein